MRVGYEPRAVQVESALGVEQDLLDLDGLDRGKKHVVTSQLEHLSHLALDGDGRFGDGRCKFERRGRGLRDAALLPLVVVAPGAHAAPVTGPREAGAHEVHHELAALADDVVAVPFGSY